MIMIMIHFPWCNDPPGKVLHVPEEDAPEEDAPGEHESRVDQNVKIVKEETRFMMMKQ